MGKFMVVILFFLQYTIAKIELNKCIDNILKWHNESRFVYLIKEDGFSMDMPTTKTVFRANFESETIRRVPVRPDFYLIQVSSVNNIGQLDHYLSKIYYDYNWNSEAQVLLINSNSVPSLKLFELMWKFYLRNVLIVTGNLKLYTYYPISHQNCSAYSGEYLGVCSNLFEIRVVKEQTRRFKGCMIREPYFIIPPFNMPLKSKKYPGVLQQIGNTFSSVMKFELGTFGNHTGFGVILANGVYTQYIGELQQNNIDYIIGINANDTYLKYFEVLPLYLYHDYYLWAPIAKEADVWLNLAMVFSWIIWILIVASFCSVAFCSYVLSRKERGKFRSFGYSTLSLWRASFGDCGDLPRSIRFKFITIIWTEATFILCAAFQCYITYVMFVPRYNEQIDSIEKLLNSKFPIGGSYFPQEFLRNANTEVSTQLLQNYHTCSMFIECVTRAAENRDMVALKEARMVMYFWQTLLENGEPMLYWFYNEIKLMAAIQMRKGHPLKDPMGLYLMRCLETGLFQKWDPYNIVPKGGSKRTNYNYMTLDHLLIAFLLLFAGVLLASTRFLYEIIWVASEEKVFLTNVKAPTIAYFKE